MEIEVKKIIDCGRGLSVHVKFDESGKPIEITKIPKSEISPCPAEPENVSLNTDGIPECNLLGCTYNLNEEFASKKKGASAVFYDSDSFPRS